MDRPLQIGIVGAGTAGTTGTMAGTGAHRSLVSRHRPRARGKLCRMSTPAPIATLASPNASLTIAVFDAVMAGEWVPTKAAANKAQFTGHPAEILRGLAKGEELAAIDVGASAGFAFELEGKSGRIELYRIDATTLALVAPPRAWWIDVVSHGAHAHDVEALFAAALAPDGVGEATELGEIELTSGKLATVYMWHKQVGAAREHAADLAAGGATTFGDGYGDGDSGLVVDAGAGTHRLCKREIEAPWASDTALVVMYVVRT